MARLGYALAVKLVSVQEPKGNIVRQFNQEVLITTYANEIHVNEGCVNEDRAYDESSANEDGGNEDD
jgi:hypothetical protein